MAGVTVTTLDQFNELEKRVEALEAVIKGGAETPPKTVPNTPETPVVTEPEGGAEMTTLSLVPNAQVTTGDWLDGVWVADDAARISVASNAALAKGQTAALPDGTNRKVINVEVFGDKTSVTFEGNKLDPSKVAGKAVIFTVPKSEGSANVPANEPVSIPDTNQKQAIPLIWWNLVGLGNNPYVQGAVLETHYREPQERHWKEIQQHNIKGIRLVTAGERFWQGSKEAGLNPAYTALIHTQFKWAAKYGVTHMNIDLHTYLRMWRVVPAGTSKPGYLYMDFNGKRTEWTPVGAPGGMSYDDYAWLVSAVCKEFMQYPNFEGVGAANEPHNRGESDFNVEQGYKANVQKIVDAWPSKTHKLHLCGCGYATTRNWVAVSSWMASIKDPHKVIVFEGHNYLDGNTGGGGAWANRNEQIPEGNFIKMVESWVKWGEDNNVALFMGEHGYPSGNASAEKATAKGLDYLISKRVPSAQWEYGPGIPNGDVLGLSDDTFAYKASRVPTVDRASKTTDKWGPRA